ncbi:hypothetical protein DXG03_003738 [Asterophora parasitica]|uniref:Uncharacterized protein n=1 Tax=Asterophora parasitica TaxID=117018 RepID=A0A9P7G796_9AGAR|nr:hypothetical protein DXG03_003738 [Asterophora parasitica]
MAVGTGFGQLFRGIGQVGGVAISSAIFQSRLTSELRQRIHGPDAEEIITKIRRSTQLVATLPPDLRIIARDSYATSLRIVFIFSACSTLLAFLVRAPLKLCLEIPDKHLDQREKADPSDDGTDTLPSTPHILADPESAVDVSEHHPSVKPGPKHRPRRLSTFESAEGVMDLEGDIPTKRSVN